MVLKKHLLNYKMQSKCLLLKLTLGKKNRLKHILMVFSQAKQHKAHFHKKINLVISKTLQHQTFISLNNLKHLSILKMHYLMT